MPFIGVYLRNRFVIDDNIGCLIDNLNELSTIHFSDSVDFFELYEFLNRQERSIDELKAYSSDPFVSINDQLLGTLHTTAQDFLRDYRVVFTEFSIELNNRLDYWPAAKGMMLAQPMGRDGYITLKGSFLDRGVRIDKN